MSLMEDMLAIKTLADEISRPSPVDIITQPDSFFIDLTRNDLRDAASIMDTARRGLASPEAYARAIELIDRAGLRARSLLKKAEREL